MATASERDARPATVLVTGDVVVDHHIYVGVQKTPAGAGSGRRGTFEHIEFGGAALVQRLLDTTADRNAEPWRAVLGLVQDAALYEHSFAVWEATGGPGPAGAGCDWRVTRPLGYGPDDERAPRRDPSAAACPQVDPAAPRDPDVVVVDDAGAGFRSRATCWPPCLTGSARAPSWIVWKMSGDLSGGTLWRRAAPGGAASSRTVLVVTAADLRRAGLDISRGLSWERTALDTERALRETTIEPLASSRHVVVSFEGAGVLWADRADGGAARCTLVYDPRSFADDPASAGRGEVFGYQACLSAGIAWGLTRALPQGGEKDAERRALDDGISRGMQARRLLFTIGHDPGDDKLPRGFPAARIRVEALREPLHAYARAALPAPANAAWTILSDAAGEAGLSGPLHQQARLVALHGLSALNGIPALHVGHFSTVDRAEIESLRRIQRLAADYRRQERPAQPLSVAVFGPPGAGKSFIVKQIAASVAQAKPLEFNLAQISDERDLIGAFHQVRDRALSGETPFVFWDEFDSQEYRWLRLLLAPMQDGCFLEGQVTHPIGKCVFVFAGGTSWSFDEFGPWKDAGNPAESAREERIWRLSKGTDFVSRLSGSLDVLGPNRRTKPRRTRGEDPTDDDTDICFPIRRALFLRADRGLASDAPLEMQPELLDALLEAPRYTHGARSFKRVLTSLREGGLPPREDLAHDICGDVAGVPAIEWLPEFLRRRAAELADAAKAHAALLARIESDIDKFAEQIHAAYMTLPPGVRSHNLTSAFAALEPFVKDSNREAARRVPGALRAAGLVVCTGGTKPGALSRDRAEAWLRRFVDLAAAEEHEGWCRFLEARGWHHAPIAKEDEAKLLHPALVKWPLLSEDNRDKDRRQVGVYLKIVFDLGYAVELV